MTNIDVNTLRAMVDNMVRNDIASQREIIADAIYALLTPPAASVRYRVYYPLITRDAFADFDTRIDAEKFAGEMRNRTSPYLTRHAWQRVSVVEILDQEPEGV